MKSGFTLIELLVSIAVIGILAGVTLLSFSRSLGTRDLDRAVEDVVGILEEARNSTVSSRDMEREGAQYGVHFDASTNEAVLFKGGNYASGTTIKKVTIGGTVGFKYITINPSGSDVIFKRFTGATVNTGGIVLYSKRNGKERGIAISGTGVVRQSNSPGALGWKVRKKITFDTATGPISADLVNFPVLVKLDGTSIDYGKTQNAGEDLRFTDADDKTPLDYEIEKWDESGSSFVWVRVPKIDANSTTDFIYMYYGNPNAADAQNPAGVWLNGYRGVWHLEDYTDSTSNNYDGSATGASQPAQQDGKIGKAQQFDGTNDRIDITMPGPSPSFTFSAWVKTNNPSKTQGIIDQRNGQGAFWACRQGGLAVIHAPFFGSSKQFRLMSPVTNGVGGCNTDTVNAPNNGVTTSWHYLAGAYVGNTMTLYVDNDTPVSNTDTADPSWISDAFTIGAHNKDDTAINVFDGIIDEVRVSNVARSADWIKASYINQNNPSAFITIE